MFCSQCGAKLPDNSRFCMQCGAKLYVEDIIEDTHEVPKDNENFIQYTKKEIDESKVKILMKANNKDFYNLMLNKNDNMYYVPSPLGTFKISPKMVDVVEVVVAFNKIMASSIKDFCEYYESYGIAMLYDSNMGGKYEIVEGLVTNAGKLAVKFLQKKKLYSYDIENVMNEGEMYYNSSSPLNNLNNKFDIIRIKLNKIGKNMDKLRIQNEIDASNHMRLEGGGFGLKGALIGIAKAEAVNFVIDMVYDSKRKNMEKKIDQYAANSIDDVIKDPNTLKTLLSGIIESINQIKEYTIECLKLDKIYNKDIIKEALAIVNNIKRGFINDDDINSACIEAFIKDPFQIEIYKECYRKFKDKNNYLTVFSRFFFMDNEINYLKHQDIINMIEKSTDISLKNEIIDIYKNGNYNSQKTAINLYTEEQSKLLNTINDKKELERIYGEVGVKEDNFLSGLSILVGALKSLRDVKENNIRAFQYINSDIESISIPDGVKEIGAFAFVGCKKLHEINFPDSLEYIHTGAFYGCNELINKSNKFEKDISIPENVTYIGDLSFKKNINDDASSRMLYFKGNSCNTLYLTAFDFERVRIPEQINNILIGPDKISTEFIFDGDSILYDYFENNGLMKYTRILTKESLAYNFIDYYLISDYEAIGKNVFAKLDDEETLSKLENIKIKQICYRAFYKSLLKKVKLEVEKIHEESFRECNDLNEVLCDDGLKFIGDRAFYGCSNLKNIKLPSSVEFIGDDFCNKGVLIECDINSYAYHYCKDNGYNIKIEPGVSCYMNALEYKEKDPKKYLELLKEAADLKYHNAYLPLIDCNLYNTEFINYGAARKYCLRYLLYFPLGENRVEVLSRLGESYLYGIARDLWDDKMIISYKYIGLYILLKAAKNNSTSAMLLLSKYYNEIKDNRDKEDIEISYIWAAMALKLGDLKAKEYMDKIDIKDKEVSENDYEKIFDYNIDASDQNLLIKEVMPRLIKMLRVHVSGIYVAHENEKANGKFKKAIAAYCKMDDDEYPILCYDATFLGSADEGFLISNKKVYCDYWNVCIKDIDYFAIYKNKSSNNYFLRFYCCIDEKEYKFDVLFKEGDIRNDDYNDAKRVVIDELSILLNVLRFDVSRNIDNLFSEIESIGASTYLAYNDDKIHRSAEIERNIERKKRCKNKFAIGDNPTYGMSVGGWGD